MRIILLLVLCCWVACALRVPPGALKISRNTVKASKQVGRLFSEVSGDERADDTAGRDSALARLLSGRVYFDPVTLGYVFGTQAALFNIAAITGFIFSFDVFNVATLSFDTPSLKLGCLFAAGMIGLGLIFDRLPSRFSQSVYRDTESYVLNLLGRDTDILKGMLLAAFLSLGAGFAEEVFFRGMLLQLIVRATNGSDLTALLISSGLFGLAHYPVFGQRPFLEALLGGAFGFMYIYSDYNLAVPIVAHSLYDGATIFLTWLAARKEIREGVKRIRSQGFAFPEWRTSALKGYAENWYLLKHVFDQADMDSDGYIDQKELPLALRMLGYSDKRPFGRDLKGAQQVFEKFDKNVDGRISFNEFTDCIREYELFSNANGNNTY